MMITKQMFLLFRFLFLMFLAGYGWAEVQGQSLRGMWFDSESKGFYEFQDTTIKEFIYETPEGERHNGTYEPQGKDQEGNFMFRATLFMEETKEERNLFIKVFPDGRTGYVQYKCMKKPFYKAKDS